MYQKTFQILCLPSELNFWYEKFWNFYFGILEFLKQLEFCNFWNVSENVPNTLLTVWTKFLVWEILEFLFGILEFLKQLEFCNFWNVSENVSNTLLTVWTKFLVWEILEFLFWNFGISKQIRSFSVLNKHSNKFVSLFLPTAHYC